MKKGKLIVFEGIDGSGKNTQLSLIRSRLHEEGVPFKTVEFPRHNQPSAYFINKYLDDLNNPYGDADELDPRLASIFFSVDRCDAGFGINRWLDKGFIVISDRYTGSNAGHQGGKIKNKEERKKYIDWLFDLEYNVLRIPKPSLNIIVSPPVEFAIKRIKEKRGSGDAHETNESHLKNSHDAYLWLADQYPDMFKAIETVEDGKELSKEDVHEKVWNLVKKEIEL